MSLLARREVSGRGEVLTVVRRSAIRLSSVVMVPVSASTGVRALPAVLLGYMDRREVGLGERRQRLLWIPGVLVDVGRVGRDLSRAHVTKRFSKVHVFAGQPEQVERRIQRYLNPFGRHARSHHAVSSGGFGQISIGGDCTQSPNLGCAFEVTLMLQVQGLG